MSAYEQEPNVAPFNGAKWLLSFAALGGAVYANHALAIMTDSLLTRISVVLVLVAIGLAIALTTTKGRAGLVFAKEAKIEARKVVWPTWPETVQTSLIILVAVVVVSLMLYFIDMGLVFLISFLTATGS